MMKAIIGSIFLVIFMSGMWIFSSKRKHLLATLLSLEFMVLGVFILFFMFISLSSYFYSLVFLTFTACEGALGLTILISMSRTHGADYFSSFSLSN
uniref:NADH-ubiquinone oxidoreductase chain 4L n=1 Tax=Ceratophysella communis TaxID=1519100 RepID=A0A6G6A4H1_9HEXA|nr:NADH dehydrogenase subunit 4L [Ceratophysella communis]QID03195.1 NADH dehydrogenase subunit 4L [Ceratophysella communis]